KSQQWGVRLHSFLIQTIKETADTKPFPLNYKYVELLSQLRGISDATEEAKIFLIQKTLAKGLPLHFPYYVPTRFEALPVAQREQLLESFWQDLQAAITPHKLVTYLADQLHRDVTEVLQVSSITYAEKK